MAGAGAGVALAGPFEDADAALGRGDYATALLLLLGPLACSAATPPPRPGSACFTNTVEALRRTTPRRSGGIALPPKRAWPRAEQSRGHVRERSRRSAELTEAVKWYRRAADLDYVEAQNNLGSL